MSTSPQALPFKSVAAALLFSIIFGPIGLLYASFWGGLIMIMLGWIVYMSNHLYSLIAIWIIATIWSVGAVEAYNKKTLRILYNK